MKFVSETIESYSPVFDTLHFSSFYYTEFRSSLLYTEDGQTYHPKPHSNADPVNVVQVIILINTDLLAAPCWYQFSPKPKPNSKPLIRRLPCLRSHNSQLHIIRYIVGF